MFWPSGREVKLLRREAIVGMQSDIILLGREAILLGREASRPNNMITPEINSKNTKAVFPLHGKTAPHSKT